MPRTSQPLMLVMVSPGCRKSPSADCCGIDLWREDAHRFSSLTSDLDFRHRSYFGLTARPDTELEPARLLCGNCCPCTSLFAVKLNVCLSQKNKTVRTRSQHPGRKSTAEAAAPAAAATAASRQSTACRSATRLRMRSAAPALQRRQNEAVQKGSDRIWQVFHQACQNCGCNNLDAAVLTVCKTMIGSTNDGVQKCLPSLKVTPAARATASMPPAPPSPC